MVFFNGESSKDSASSVTIEVGMGSRGGATFGSGSGRK